MLLSFRVDERHPKHNANVATKAVHRPIKDQIKAVRRDHAPQRQLFVCTQPRMQQNQVTLTERPILACLSSCPKHLPLHSLILNNMSLPKDLTLHSRSMNRAFTRMCACFHHRHLMCHGSLWRFSFSAWICTPKLMLQPNSAAG